MCLKIHFLKEQLKANNFVHDKTGWAILGEVWHVYFDCHFKSHGLCQKAAEIDIFALCNQMKDWLLIRLITAVIYAPTTSYSHVIFTGYSHQLSSRTRYLPIQWFIIVRVYVRVYVMMTFAFNISVDTSFSNTLSWYKIWVFRLKFPCCYSFKVQ